MKGRSFWKLTWVIWAFFWNTTVMDACQVPVFRYALERWRPDSYLIRVYYEKALKPEEKRLLADIQKHSVDSGDASMNMEVELVDLSKFTQRGSNFKALPWIEVEYPKKYFKVGPNGESSKTKEAPKGKNLIFSGPMNRENIDRIKNSPARREIVKRLIAGDSVVWIFLAGENVDKSHRYKTVLLKALAAAQGEIVLPELNPNDAEDDIVKGIPLKVSFTVIELSDNEKEVVFRNMLMNSSPEILKKHKGKTVAFPVVGRGRAWDYLAGDEISAGNIKDISYSLCEPCSCTVKWENPGMDLLIHADWDRWLEESDRFEKPIPALQTHTDLLTPSKSTNKTEKASKGN